MTKLLLLYFLALSSPAMAKETVEVIALEYPPYTTVNMKSHGENFVLLRQKLLNQDKLRIKPLFLPPGRAEKLISKGNWCSSFYPPSANYAQYKFITLTERNYEFGLFRYRQMGSFNWQNFSELKGHKVALLRTNLIGPLAMAIHNSGLEIVYVESFQQGLNLVLKDRVDFAFGERNLPTDLKLPKQQQAQLQFSDNLLGTAPIGIYVNAQCQKYFNLMES